MKLEKGQTRMTDPKGVEQQKAALLTMIVTLGQGIGNNADYDVTAFKYSTPEQIEQYASDLYANAGNRQGYEDALDDAAADVMDHHFSTMGAHAAYEDERALNIYSTIHMMLDRIARGEY